MSTLTEMAEKLEDHGKVATPEMVRAALDDGGRAVVTVRSWKTGHHVTLLFVCRKRKPGGHGWIPRNTTAGRVGFAEADCIEVRDPNLDYGENYVGRFYGDTGEWKASTTADGKRVWLGERIITSALTGTELTSEVFLASQCSFCGKGLTDPESIERGIGPECYGKHTASQSAKYAATV